MSRESIAIVGAACRFPGAPTLADFWDLLASERSAVTEIPADRWSKSFYYHPRPGTRGRSYTWAAGVIDAVDQFDASFFGISPREAEQLDPQQRLVLELAWEALEDAGIPAANLSGTEVGVFIGASGTDYANARLWDPAGGDAYFMTGTTGSIVSNRLSYALDLHGPSITIDTACSSSLVALQLAFRAIQEERIPAAIVGGVNLLLSPYPFVGFCSASMLSRTGQCFAFDSRADGYVRAEGGGIVVLKPLSRALADGDRIRGVILAVGTNSDGRTTGLSLPNRAAQAELLLKVYSDAGISPDSLSFVEAHGTGTPVGDPIELSALAEVLGQGRPEPLPVGSVKTNVGHLETASGMAGLLKTMLSLEKRMLPSSLNFESPHPQLDLPALNLQIATTPTVLTSRGNPLIAGVNSFGFGGTNAHAVMASAPRSVARLSAAPTAVMPLLLSARSEEALGALAQRWAELLSGKSLPAAAPLLRAAARRRDHHPYRLVASGEGPDDIAEALCSLGSPHPRLTVGKAVASRGLAFVFSGNGAQWVGMARDALEHSAAFRQGLKEVDRHLQAFLGWSVQDQLSRAGDEVEIERTDVAQPLLFAVQVAIVSALRAAGIHAAAHLGHSVGEVAAAWASGALSLDAACRIIVIRSRQQQRTQGMGRMAALGLSPEMTLEVLEGHPEVTLAALNSANSVTVAGPAAALESLGARAQQEGWNFIPLDLDYAFHSPALDLIEKDLLSELAWLQPEKGPNSFVSTVTGGPLSNDRLDAVYWWRNVREPVRFRDAIEHLVAEGFRIFVEVGPEPVLQSYVRQTLRAADTEGRTLATLTRNVATSDPFVDIAAACHVAGYDISRHSVFDGPVAAGSELPKYPWQRERHWFKRTGEGIALSGPVHDHPLLGFRWDRQVRVWSNVIDLDLHPWLADHVVEGVPLLPGTATVEIALGAARASLPAGRAIEVSDLNIWKAVSLEGQRSADLRTRLDAEGRVEIESRTRGSEESWTLHAAGRVASVPFEAVTNGDASRTGACGESCRSIEGDEIYAAAARLGLDYGPRFQVVSRVELAGTAGARVHFDPRAAELSGGDFMVNPILLDGALHGFLALLLEHAPAEEGTTFLPFRFGRVLAYEPYGRQPSYAELMVERLGSRSASGSIAVFDSAGGRIADLKECWFRRVRLNRREKMSERGLHFVLAAVPQSAEAAVSPRTPRELVTAAEVAELAPAGVEKGLLFEGYLAASAYDAVTQIAPVDHVISLEALVLSGALSADAVPLLQALLDLLARHHLAWREAGGWRLAGQSELPEPATIWRSLIEEDASMTGELALTAAMSAALPGILRQGLSSEPALAPDLVEQFLFDSPSGRRILGELCDAVREIAHGWPANRPLRILEVGAGSGILTRRLLRELADWPGTLRYLATDPDPEAAARLSRILSGRPGLSAAQLDLSQEGSGVDLPAGAFDLAVTAYGLTRLALDRGSLASLRDLLARNGLLVAAEPTPNEIWMRIFGVRAGWWKEDGLSIVPISPMRASAEWGEMLAEAGFATISAHPVAASPWIGVLLAAHRPHATATSVAPSPDAAVLVVAEASHPLAPLLVEQLAAAGRRCQRLIRPVAGEGAQWNAALGDAAPGDGAPAGDGVPEIVILPPAAAFASLAGAECDAVSARASLRLMEVIDLAKLAGKTWPRARLWIVTRGAWHATSTGALAIEGALWGGSRVLINEMSELDSRLVELPSDENAERSCTYLSAELLSPDDEREIVWRQGGRYALRLRRGLPARSLPGTAVELRIDTPGLLDSLRWVPVERGEPGPGQVAIEVRAASVNFRDMMWAMGLLPEEALLDGFAGSNLGLECAGVVTAVGQGVVGLKAGDRVAALGSACLGTKLIAPAKAVVRLPENLDFAAAATIPVVYLTAIYALGQLARLKEGEKVLIHGGAGGVGLAAIAYAKHVGAVVFATAGSDVKRRFLREFGVDHVLDSRDLSFAEQVRELTGGSGVDVVLNSLGGEAMERSLGLLRPFGRFLELGKRDFYLNTRVGLRPLRRNISYYAIDVDCLPVEHPELAADLLREVMALLEKGVLHPLPHRIYPFAEATEAFRLMQSAGHIGKIVLTPDPRAAQAEPTRALHIRSDGTYLVTGGLSGFGLETARWLARRGARHLALLGRRGEDTPGASEALLALAADGVHARALSCDVSDPSALAGTLEEIRRNMPPLRGIVHGAMVVADGFLRDASPADIESVLAPKLAGAVNLDRLTRADPVEVFLLYSSATTVIGAPGQGSYVAANLGLEALARGRAAEGLPSLAVAWGPISDVGFLARDEQMREGLARRLAATPISAAQALESLPELWSSGLPVAAFAAVQWQSARRLPILSGPSFADFAVEGPAADISLSELIAERPPEEAKQLIADLLAREIAHILSTAPERIDHHRPLSDLGMDSLMAVELRLALEQRLGLAMPLMSMTEGVTLAGLAARILSVSLGQATHDQDIAAAALRHESTSLSATLPLAANESGPGRQESGREAAAT